MLGFYFLKEVTEDQVDTNAAYILFYERQDLERGQFMPDITDKEPGVAEADEEFDKEFKRMCVLQWYMSKYIRWNIYLYVDIIYMYIYIYEIFVCINIYCFVK